MVSRCISDQRLPYEKLRYSRAFVRRISIDPSDLSYDFAYSLREVFDDVITYPANAVVVFHLEPDEGIEEKGRNEIDNWQVVFYDVSRNRDEASEAKKNKL